MSEKRRDAEDGEAYTWEEMAAYYKGKYSQKNIAAYWETCIPVRQKKGKGKGKAEAEAKPKAKAKVKVQAKAKAKSEPKAKAKVKAKAKAAKKETKPAGNYKVCVAGGSGGVGQPLALLMGMDPNVGDLRIFDMSSAAVPPAGVAADLGHLERKCSTRGHALEVGSKPIDHAEDCLSGCHLVLVAAGVPRKPGQTWDQLFKTNADIAKGIVEACAKFCPEAVVGITANPQNSVVPAMAELYKKKGLDPMKIVGITTLDVVRANKFVGEITAKNPNYVNVPVIGGHFGVTILPVFSQDKESAKIDKDKIEALDKRVQNAHNVLVDAKAGKGNATLSMAYAGARFAKAVFAGLSGRKRVECAYCKSDVTELPYFNQKVVFGEGGIVKVLPLGELNEYETTRLEEAKTQLKSDIDMGLKYAEANTLA